MADVLIKAALLTLMLVCRPVTVWAETDTHETTVHETDSAEGQEAGQENGHHGELHLMDVLTNIEFIASVVNFLLLLTILIWFGRKPVEHFLKTRRSSVEQGLAEAAKMKTEAEAKFREYSDRIERLDQEIERLTSDIAEAAKEEKVRIIQDAEQRVERLKQDTERLVEQQMKQLRSDIVAEVVNAAINSAESVLEKSLNAQDQQKLARDYVVQITQTTKPEERT